MSYTYERHVFAPNKVVKHLACRYCGLVALRNPFTEWSIRMGCNSAEHSEYRRERKAATRAG